MKKEYDFSNGERGKFFRKNKIQKTIRIDADVLDFFMTMSADVEIPYQTLINLTLRKFAVEDSELTIKVPRRKRA
jgi:uncharacterized protein (DUF4415 family)